MKLNIALIFGGVSSEHEVSIKSANTIISNMSQEKYNILPIYITKEGNWLLYEGPIQNNLDSIPWDNLSVNCLINYDRTNRGLLRIVDDKINTIPIDCILPVLHGTTTEDGKIQGIFEMANIPYVGCDVTSSAISFDKAITKIIATSININQAKYLVFSLENLQDEENMLASIENKLGYPCFIKPANEGSSVGITKACNKEEALLGIKLAFNYDKKIVIEEEIVGNEVECAILGTGFSDTKASRVAEVLAASTFYDYDAKYNNPESKTVIPANIKDEVAKKIQENALKIFKTLGCSGLSRVDFFVKKDTDEVIFNEINTFPGFTSISMYPMLWEDSGVPLSNLIDELIKIAIEK